MFLASIDNKVLIKGDKMNKLFIFIICTVSSMSFTFAAPICSQQSGDFSLLENTNASISRPSHNRVKRTRGKGLSERSKHRSVRSPRHR